MEIKEYVDRKKRMCDTYEDCETCRIMSEFLGVMEMDCADFCMEFPEDVIQIIKGWEYENPRPTNKQKFIEIFSNKPWQRKNEKGLHRCGYEYCNESIPCNDCSWWEEPENAYDHELIYKEYIANEEMREYKEVVKNSTIEENLKEQITNVIDNALQGITGDEQESLPQDSESPDIVITKPDGEIQNYQSNGVQGVSEALIEESWE